MRFHGYARIGCILIDKTTDFICKSLIYNRFGSNVNFTKLLNFLISILNLYQIFYKPCAAKGKWIMHGGRIIVVNNILSVQNIEHRIIAENRIYIFYGRVILKRIYYRRNFCSDVKVINFLNAFQLCSVVATNRFMEISSACILKSTLHW